MTHAAIVENNTTKHEELTISVKDCNDTKVCNKTIIPEISTHTLNNTDNISSNNTDVNENNEASNQTTSNNITDTDTILKYVYKTGDKVEVDSKTKGHFKNQLKRRKRSIQDPLSPRPSKYQRPALIVNYETSHGPAAKSEWSPPLNSANIIKNANRADFKIESRHENPQNKNKGHINKVPKHDSGEVTNLNEGSNESTDREQYNNNKEDTSRESDESSEQHDYRQVPNRSAYRQNSAESYEDARDKNAVSDESSENYKNAYAESNEDVGSNESNNDASSEQPHRESTEHSRYRHDTKPYYANGREGQKENYRGDEQDSSAEDVSESSSETYIRSTKPYDTPQENHQKQIVRSSDENSGENEDNRYGRTPIPQDKNNQEHSKSSYIRDNKESSAENSGESDEKELNPSKYRAYNSDLTKPVNNRSSVPIQDIDLGDFSYERINVNENGKVIALKDNSDNTDPNAAVEILPSKTLSPGTTSHDVLELVKNIHKPLNYSDKLIHINDGEVRPVVEINTEIDEDSSEGNIKSNSNTFDSLETELKGVNTNDHDKSSKIRNENQDVENGDVKQQYERIPLNYNHNQNTQIDVPTTVPQVEGTSELEDTPKTEDVPKEDITVTKSEGSIDVAPEDIKYDENLNFKFDDIQIKLPDIMLPDDILSFTKAHSPFYDENNEDKNSHYTGQRSEDKNNRDDDNDNDEDDDAAPAYYGYYDDRSDKKEDYRKKNIDDEEDDEEEDLYEKFVRERFGKSGTFEKRSEKLVKRPLNPELSQTIQSILKKTANIDEQAKKSGDPNAGYMWTLEYGENL